MTAGLIPKLNEIRKPPAEIDFNWKFVRSRFDFREAVMDQLDRVVLPMAAAKPLSQIFLSVIRLWQEVLETWAGQYFSKSVLPLAETIGSNQSVEECVAVPIAVVRYSRHHSGDHHLGQHLTQVHKLHEKRCIGVLPGVFHA